MTERPRFTSIEDINFMKKNGNSKLGEGSFGNVCLITHVKDPSTLYALKSMEILDDIERKYVMQEIELHYGLVHPNVIRMYDFFLKGNKAYVILEYAPKGDLFKLLHRSLFIPESDLERMFVQILLAFDHIHERSILHRDLKPENILLNDKLDAKLCDFGWSAKYSEKENRETLCGTAEYMAPEIIYGKKQTQKTDVWALGI